MLLVLLSTLLPFLVSAKPDGSPSCVLEPNHAGLASWGWEKATWKFTNFRGDPLKCYIPGVPLLVRVEQKSFNGFVVKGPEDSKFEDLVGPIFPRYKVVDTDNCVTHTEATARSSVVMKWTANSYMGKVTFHATTFTATNKDEPSRAGTYGKSEVTFEECSKDDIPWAAYDIWHCPDFVEKLNFSHVYECDMHAMCPKDMRCCHGVKGGHICYPPDYEEKKQGEGKCSNFRDTDYNCPDYAKGDPDSCREMNSWMGKNCRFSCCQQWLPTTARPTTPAPSTAAPSLVPENRDPKCLKFWDEEKDAEKCAKWIVRKKDSCKDIWSWESRACRRMCCDFGLEPPEVPTTPIWYNTTKAPRTVRPYPVPRLGCDHLYDANYTCDFWVNYEPDQCHEEESWERTECERACCRYVLGPVPFTTTTTTTPKPHWGCEEYRNFGYDDKCNELVIKDPFVCKNETSYEHSSCIKACCEYSWWYSTTTPYPTHPTARQNCANLRNQDDKCHSHVLRNPKYCADAWSWERQMCGRSCCEYGTIKVPTTPATPLHKYEKPQTSFRIDNHENVEKTWSTSPCADLEDREYDCPQWVRQDPKQCHNTGSWEFHNCRRTCCKYDDIPPQTTTTTQGPYVPIFRKVEVPQIPTNGEYPSRVEPKKIDTAEGDCVDKDHFCPDWKGYCSFDDFTIRNCPKTCETCGPKIEAKHDQAEEVEKKEGEEEEEEKKVTEEEEEMEEEKKDSASTTAAASTSKSDSSTTPASTPAASKTSASASTSTPASASPSSNSTVSASTASA